MTIRKYLLSTLFLGLGALGAVTSAQAAGTAQQEAACRSDVRRYCHKIPQNAGDNAFLACLQDHRAKLTPPCRNVLESNGV